MTDLTPTTERARAVAAGVREDQLDAPTPMPGTSVRELLNHLLGLTVAFRDAAAKLDGPTTNTPPAKVTELLHGWDLARATGQAYDVSDAEADAVLPIVTPEQSDPDGRGRGDLFGPVVAVPADAPPFDRVLGLAGRDPAWSPAD